MPTTISTYLIFLVVIMGLGGWISVDKMLDAKAKAVDIQKQLDSANDTIKKERKMAEDANSRAQQTQLEKQVIENEAKANRDCIANKSCGVRVELRYKTCPVYSSDSSGSGSDELQEQNRRNFELWINNLQESVRLDKLYITKLQEDVKFRSDKNYCKPK